MIFLDNKIVIIGGGAAAVSAVKTIRSIDLQSEIIVLGEEKHIPYYRIKVSKGLLGGLDEGKLLIQKKEWYEENNVTLCLGQKVISISPERKEITLKDGSLVQYSKLLLANGASNFTPPIRGIDKFGVFSLRTLEGGLKIIDYLKNSETVLLIGGGIQNLEMADVLSKGGKKVIIAEFASRLMPRQLDSLASDILKSSIESQGVEVMLSTQIEEILGEGKAEGFITQSGIRRSCDMVIYSTGILPNVDIVRNTRLEVNKGIRVNERMETSIKDIYAAGDVAEFNGNVYGLWSTASQQGKIAGANMCGQNPTFEPAPPLTTMDAFGLSVCSMGDITENENTHLLVEVDNENLRYLKVFIRNRRALGTIVIGDMKKFMQIKSLINSGVETDFDKFTTH